MLFEDKPSLNLARIRRKLFRHTLFWRGFLIGSILVVFLAIAALFFTPVLRVAYDLVFGPVNVISIVVAKKEPIKNTDGRTNILILGIGGQAHDGPNLSDTIIVASVKTVFSSTEKPDQLPIVLISIPRDLYLDSLKGKINTAYAIGQEEGGGTGLILAKSAASEVTGLPIHFAVRVDFSAFTKTVDLLGGVDINVENTFDDYHYPLAGKEDDTCNFNSEEISSRTATMSADEVFPCRYEHVHFSRGPTHMNGEMALEYVRSRYASSEEGTDFARSRRQQLLISAVKQKVLSSETLLNPVKIEATYNILKDHIDTDIPPSQWNELVKLAITYRGASFKNVVLGKESEFLVNPPIDSRGWILFPRTGNFDEIHNYIKSSLEGKDNSQNQSSGSK